MNLIEYPLIRIKSENWLDEEELIPLFDEYFYSSKVKVFHDYYYNKEFADCNGVVYTVVNRVLPTSIWRSLFRSLPGVYQVKLLFGKTGKIIQVDDLKKDLISGINRFNNSDTKEIEEKLIAEIHNSNSIKEVLTGDRDKKTK